MLYILNSDGRRIGKLVAWLARATGLPTSRVGYHVTATVRGPQPEPRARSGNGLGSSGPGRARRRTLAKRVAKGKSNRLH
jgi:hypothetical protein